MTRSPYEVLVNVRLYDWHLFITRSGVSLYRNPLHAFEKQWWPPKFTKAEFRAKPEWKRFAVYKLFGYRA